MDTLKHCSSCNKPLAPNAPQGLCPECLIKAGLGTGVDIGPETQAGRSKIPFTPPKPEELAQHFPQLDILGFVGQGGMGAVYKARQKQLDRVVALKILPPQVASGPGFADRFTREARALAKLNHPHIVTLYEFGQVQNVPAEGGTPAPLYFFLMEFVDGINLRQLLNAGRVAPDEALAIVPQICDALQYAHERGIVHRDIKPENILLSKEGQVKIADFGVAKIVGADGGAGNPLPADGTHGVASPADELTEAGSVLGTPQYMAPEQIAQPLEVDHRADIYSLGVVFYQMLTGELPGKPIERPSGKVQIDVRLDEVVLRALEKEPELRYQQASVFKTEVENISTTPMEPSTPEEEPKRMNKKTYAIIAVIALLITAAGYGASLIFSDSHKNQTASGTAQTNQTNSITPVVANANGVRLTIDLRDGSHVVGKTVEDSLSIHSIALGDMKLPWTSIRSIEYTGSTNLARLTETNGDALTVQLATDTLALQTGFGQTELPVNVIRSLKVTSLAAPNVVTPLPGESGSRLAIELWDGSQVAGKALDATVNFHSSAMGDLKLTWSGIRSLVYASTNSDTGRLTTTNGDIYEVQFTATAVLVGTSFGKTELPVNTIRSIKVSAPAGSGQLPSGLVALWSGEGNANDSVGGNNGVLHGGVSFEPGKVGQAFSFDGINSYVEVPSSAAITPTGPFTAMAWVKFLRTSGNNGASVMVKGADAEAELDWALNISTFHRLRPHVNVDHGWIYFDCASTLMPGTWYHVAMVYDGTSLLGYVNGRLDGTRAVSGTLQATDNSLRIGSYAPVNGTVSKCFFSGCIDEASLFNRALSASEIQAICVEQNGGELPPPPPSTSTPNF